MRNALAQTLAVFVSAALGCGGASATTTLEPRTARAGPELRAAAPLEATAQPGVQSVPNVCEASAAEACDALDNNCDGRIDEGCGWGSGALQVSASWNTGADIDLYVTEPNGFRISNLSDASPSGGRLDHDARGACVPGGDSVENIVWSAAAPPGNYLVELHYWGACGSGGPTEVSVSVSARGGVVGVYRISLSEGQRVPVVALPL